jgi:hypothetical protein
MLTSIMMPSQTLIDLKFYPNIDQYLRNRRVNFQLNPRLDLELYSIV